jgi:hypothetical protein
MQVYCIWYLHLKNNFWADRIRPGYCIIHPELALGPDPQLDPTFWT